MSKEKTETNNKDVPIPYFLKNKNWYYYDEKLEMYNLTKNATPKARESYNEFYAEEIAENTITKK